MKNSPVLMLVLVSLGLCVVCVAQWHREAAFRHHLAVAANELQSASVAHHEVIENSSAFEKEIARLTQLRADTEAKLVEVTDQLTAARKLAAGAGDVLGDRNRAVEAHNAAMTEANARLQQVTAERDHALEDLNQRTRAYNELITKFNKLAR